MAEPCKIFVGNLPYDCEDKDLRDHFGDNRTVTDAVVIYDRDSNRSRGFGFVSFGTESEAQNAIEELHESELLGRKITVRAAESKRGGGGGGFRGGRRDNYSGGYGRGGGGYGSGGGRRNYDGYRGGYGGGGYGGGVFFRSPLG